MQIKISKKVFKDYIKSILIEYMNQNTTGDPGKEGHMGGTGSIDRDENGNGNIIDQKPGGGEVIGAGSSKVTEDDSSENSNFSNNNSEDENVDNEIIKQVAKIIGTSTIETAKA
jgi:hypothetical protein